jgi:hypothetical protein
MPSVMSMECSEKCLKIIIIELLNKGKSCSYQWTIQDMTDIFLFCLSFWLNTAGY